MKTRERRRGLFIRCPYRANHLLAHATLGAAPTVRGGEPSLLLFLRFHERHDGRTESGGRFVECARDGLDVEWVEVSCACNRGSRWELSPSIIARLVPDNNTRDVHPAEVGAPCTSRAKPAQ